MMKSVRFALACVSALVYLMFEGVYVLLYITYQYITAFTRRDSLEHGIDNLPNYTRRPVAPWAIVNTWWLGTIASTFVVEWWRGALVVAATLALLYASCSLYGSEWHNSNSNSTPRRPE